MSCWDGPYPEQPEDERESEWEDPEDNAWRGDVHLEGWPEGLAGPEYWFWRRWLEGGEEGK